MYVQVGDLEIFVTIYVNSTFVRMSPFKGLHYAIWGFEMSIVLLSLVIQIFFATGIFMERVVASKLLEKYDKRNYPFVGAYLLTFNVSASLSGAFTMMRYLYTDYYRMLLFTFPMMILMTAIAFTIIYVLYCVNGACNVGVAIFGGVAMILLDQQAETTQLLLSLLDLVVVL
ncbi:unnamed protein product, partial [Mesorhabditis spiculigera]